MLMQTAGSQKSVGSRGSNASSKYKKVQRNSQVQEELFGNPQPASRARSIGKQVGPDTATISSKQLKELKESLKVGKATNAVVISEHELAKMRRAATVQSKEQVQTEQRILKEQQQQTLNAARARKDRIIKKEQERQKQAALSEMEQEQLNQRAVFKDRAQEIQYENHDDVKHMNQKVLYAKCVTIRDKQLDEKRKALDNVQTEQERLDLMMEIERLKAIQFYEEREVVKKQQAKQGAVVIQDQIKERDMVRIKEQEMKAQESAQMIKQMKALEEEEAKVAVEKKQQGIRLLAEVEEANRQAVLVKDEKSKLERIEDEKIMEYQLQKAAQEQAWLEEQERIKIEKEKEVQRLREMQERAADRQEELDALRAKRATEAQERAARAKEKKEAEHRAKINAELQEARLQQAREKDIRLALVAKSEKEEFNRIIQAQKAEIQIEEKQEEVKQQMRYNHAGQLVNQISSNDELRKQQRRDYLEEIITLRKQQDDEKRRLLYIKEKKMQELQSNHIPDKYQADLAKMKVAVDF